MATAQSVFSHSVRECAIESSVQCKELQKEDVSPGAWVCEEMTLSDQ